jgi:hypothetical protein
VAWFGCGQVCDNATLGLRDQIVIPVDDSGKRKAAITRRLKRGIYRLGRAVRNCHQGYKKCRLRAGNGLPDSGTTNCPACFATIADVNAGHLITGMQRELGGGIAR